MTKNPESEEEYRRAIQAHDEAHTPGPNGAAPEQETLQNTKARVDAARARLVAENNWPVEKTS